MKLYGMFSEEIISMLVAGYPNATECVMKATQLTKRGKQEVYLYQAYVLFALAEQYNKPGNHLLDIGTYHGFTATVMALAAPRAQVITLNPTSWEYDETSKALMRVPNIRCLKFSSADYLRQYPSARFDMIFVDGDHKRVRDDFAYWERLTNGGLMLFHDYSPQDSVRPCQVVFDALNEWKLERGDFDVVVIDSNRVGMAGWYRHV